MAARRYVLLTTLAVAIAVIAVGALAASTAAAQQPAVPITGPLIDTHPATCTVCHDPVGPFTRPWDHAIGGPTAWQNCGKCHTTQAQQVANSPHKPVGCKCHAILHKGSGVAWIFYYLPWAPGKIAFAPGSPQKWSWHYAVYTPQNMTKEIASLPDGSISVGLWNPFTNQFIGLKGGRAGNLAASCFFCHFINVTRYASMAGLFHK